MAWAAAPRSSRTRSAASEIATDGVAGPARSGSTPWARPEIAENAVGGSEIGTDSVGKDALVVDGVGANELDEVHEHESDEVEVEDGIEHDGAYGIATARVECLFADEDLLSVSIDWTDTNSHAERLTSDVEIDRGLRADGETRRSCGAPSTGAAERPTRPGSSPHATCLQSQPRSGRAG